MSSSINWMDNKVIGTGTSRQMTRTTYTAPPETAAGYAAPPPAQRTPSVPAAPAQQSAAEPNNQTVQNDFVPGTPLPFKQGFPPATERGYIPFYLASNIGKNVRAEFFIGGSQYSDKVGKLIEVGISYFVLEDVNSRTHVMCDLYSVKFVTVLMDGSCIIA